MAGATGSEHAPHARAGVVLDRLPVRAMRRLAHLAGLDHAGMAAAAVAAAVAQVTIGGRSSHPASSVSQFVQRDLRGLRQRLRRQHGEAVDAHLVRTGRRHRSGAGKAGPSLADSSVRPGPPAAAGPAGSHESPPRGGLRARASRPGLEVAARMDSNHRMPESESVPYHLATGLWDRLYAHRGAMARVPLTLRELGGAAGPCRPTFLRSTSRVAGHEPGAAQLKRSATRRTRPARGRCPGGWRRPGRCCRHLRR